MGSVAIDLFSLPPATYGGEVYDILALAVDRHTGWMIGIPTRIKGLTAQKLGKMFVNHEGWDMCDVPYEVSSDQGGQFAGEWWRTLCSQLGVKQAFSQAYHHQANGMAENAGKRLQHMLRKLHSEEEEEVTWMELLLKAIRIQMDTPGETGLSPYQLVMGREREPQGRSEQGDNDCTNEQGYNDRTEWRDTWVSDEGNRAHKHASDIVNERRKEAPFFEAGDKVWTIVPRTPIGPVGATKIDNRWYGPRLVRGRLSENIYNIQIAKNPDKFRDYHISQLKRYVDEALTGEAIPLWYSAPRGRSTATGEQEEQGEDYEVEDVLSTRINSQTGRREYEVQWVGYKDTTWEFMESFINNPYGEYLGKSPSASINFPRDWRTEAGEGIIPGTE
jgi:hypothetical protein